MVFKNHFVKAWWFFYAFYLAMMRSTKQTTQTTATRSIIEKYVELRVL